jgi:hypothetical protein
MSGLMPTMFESVRREGIRAARAGRQHAISRYRPHPADLMGRLLFWRQGQPEIWH